MSINTAAGSPLKKRLDIALAEAGSARTRSAAADLIKRGKVMVNGAVAQKAGHIVRIAESDGLPADRIEVTEADAYVGRGGLKLAGALDAFGIDLAGKTVIDIGSSTGGFTECALRREAAHVFAIDVGTDQLAPSLRADSRVTVMEQTDIRDVTALPVPADVAVIDVSFISVVQVIPTLARLMKAAVPGSSDPAAEAVVLVKPQFEADESLRKTKGIVKDPHKRLEAIEKVKKAATEAGWAIRAETPSPIAGGDGNIEYFLHIASILRK